MSKPKEAATVSLEAIVGQLDMATDSLTSVLHLPTGEIREFFDHAELYFGSEPEDMEDWQRREIEEREEALSSDNYLVLPDSFEIHEWSIMRDYCATVADDDLRDRLLRAIHGRGAFRYFKDRLYDADLRDDWFAFRRAALARIARAWLDDNGVPFRDDTA